VPRNPDFLIIGAMKAGTTSLFRWLGRLEDVELPATKEIHFFFDEERWSKGMGWYQSFFDNAATVTGEASPGYTDPDRAVLCASRILETLPDVRLIFLARNPIDRLRSHYRHWVQRGRERRPFPEAATVDSPYVTRSMYWRSLQPYMERFTDDQLLIVRFEELIEDGGAWESILSHLGLPPHPRPTDNQNPTEALRGYSKLFDRLATGGTLSRLEFLPKPLKRAGARLMTSDSRRYRELIASSRDDVAVQVQAELWDDIAKLEAELGTTLWRR
jgi:hypothetical protein